MYNSILLDIKSTIEYGKRARVSQRMRVTRQLPKPETKVIMPSERESVFKGGRALDRQCAKCTPETCDRRDPVRWNCYMNRNPEYVAQYGMTQERLFREVFC